MKEYLAVTRALADANRVRMLCALRGGELCVCQLIELLGLAPSTVSKHLSVMHQAGLIDSRKEGRWVYYRLPSQAESKTAERFTQEAFRALSDNPVIIADKNRLDGIRTSDLEELCHRVLCRS